MEKLYLVSQKEKREKNVQSKRKKGRVKRQ